MRGLIQWNPPTCTFHLPSRSFTLVATAALAAYPGHPPTNPDITGADISARDKAVADDAFEGRGPGQRRTARRRRNGSPTN